MKNVPMIRSHAQHDSCNRVDVLGNSPKGNNLIILSPTEMELSEVSYLFLFQYSVTYSFSLPYSQLLPYSKTGLKGLIFLMMTHKNSLFSQ